MMNLSGRGVVITSVGSGLGRKHALLLGRCGAHIVVNDRSQVAARLELENAGHGRPAKGAG